jgi:hypothetical protein
MGKHTAEPPKTDIVHQVPKVLKTRTHTFLVFCKHTMLELPAGFIAILIFEGNRGGWLHLIGTDSEGATHAISAFVMFL